MFSSPPDDCTAAEAAELASLAYDGWEMNDTRQATAFVDKMKHCNGTVAGKGTAMNMLAMDFSLTFAELSLTSLKDANACLATLVPQFPFWLVAVERSPLRHVATGLCPTTAANAKRQIKTGKLKDASVITQEDHHAMVCFALDNCHAVCFGALSSQGKGVGMGASSSPPLSQGLLAAMECQTVQSCIEAKAFQLMRSLSMTARLMDDLLSASRALQRMRCCQDHFQCVDTTFDPIRMSMRGIFSNEHDGEKEMQLNVESRMSDPPLHPSAHRHDISFLNVSAFADKGTTLRTANVNTKSMTLCHFVVSLTPAP